MATGQNAFLQSFTDSYLARRDRVRGVEQAINEIKRNNQLRAEQRAQQIADEQRQRQYQEADYQRKRADSLADYDMERKNKLSDMNAANALQEKNKAAEIFSKLDVNVQQWIIRNNGGKMPETIAEMAQIANTPETKTKPGTPLVSPVNIPGMSGLPVPLPTAIMPKTPDVTTTTPPPGLASADDVRIADAARLRAETANNKTDVSVDKDRLSRAYRLVDDYAVADMPLARKQADTKAARQMIWEAISKGTDDEGTQMPENFMLSESGMTAAQRQRNDYYRYITDINTSRNLAEGGTDPTPFFPTLTPPGQSSAPVYPVQPIMPQNMPGYLPPLPGIPTIGGSGGSAVVKPSKNPFSGKPTANPFGPLLEHARKKQTLAIQNTQSVIDNRGKSTAKAKVGSGAKPPSSEWMDKYGGMFDPKVLKDERLQGIARTIASTIPMDSKTNTRTPSVMAMIAIQDLHKAAGIDRKLYVPPTGGTVDRAVKFGKENYTPAVLNKMSLESWKKRLMTFFQVKIVDANLESIAEHSYALTHPGYAKTRLYSTAGSKAKKAQGGS